MNPETLTERLHSTLPQTQCTRCGYADCRSYAEAIAHGDAGIDQCPPGGAEGIERLARVVGSPVVALNPRHGTEGPRLLASIDEDWCIGCTLCIDACPVDCIVGASRHMHTVVAAQCTGCELCVPACPVDCIRLANATGARTGWAAWSESQAREARARYEARQARQRAAELEAKARKGDDVPATPLVTDATGPERKRATIEAVLARARDRRAEARDDAGR